MLVSLSVAYHPLRAHIEAGLLREHGIPAWVWGDVTSCSYGTVTTGGCRVMVDEENLASAQEVLQAPAGDDGAARTEEPGSEVEPVQVPLTVESALGTGVVSGALLLPLVVIGFTLVGAVVTAVWATLSRARDLPGDFLTSLSSALAAIAVPGVIYGAVLGALGGLAAWFISDYKRRGRAGRWFIGLMIVFMAIIALLL